MKSVRSIATVQAVLALPNSAGWPDLMAGPALHRPFGIVAMLRLHAL